MVRPLRIEFADALYHVMSRGNDRRAIVRDDASRSVAAWLARRRFGYKTRDIAEALGYRSHGGVVTAIGRIEAATEPLGRTLRKRERQLGSD
jgi:chromosomal replication initiation ATPase DnaA